MRLLTITKDDYFGVSTTTPTLLREISKRFARYLRNADVIYSPHKRCMSTVSEPIAQAAGTEMQFVESGSLVVYEGQTVSLTFTSLPDLTYKIKFIENKSSNERRLDLVAENDKSGTFTFQNFDSNLGSTNDRPFQFAISEDGFSYYMVFSVLSIDRTKLLNYSIYKSK